MSDTYTQIAPNSTGNRIRTKTATVNNVTVHTQFVAFDPLPTWYICVTPTNLRQNKYLLSFINIGTQNIYKLRKLFLSNAALLALAGVALEFDVIRVVSVNGGVIATYNAADTIDGLMTDTNIRVSANSCTESSLLYPWYTNNDEIGLTGGFPQATIQALISIQPEGAEMKELTCRQNEGFTVKQITNTVLGSYSILAVVTREPL